MTPDEVRATFHHELTVDQAMTALHAFSDDKANHMQHRLAAAEAMLDLRQGRSVQSALARFRRALGVK